MYIGWRNSKSVSSAKAPKIGYVHQSQLNTWFGQMYKSFSNYAMYRIKLIDFVCFQFKTKNYLCVCACEERLVVTCRSHHFYCHRIKKMKERVFTYYMNIPVIRWTCFWINQLHLFVIEKQPHFESVNVICNFLLMENVNVIFTHAQTQPKMIERISFGHSDWTEK